MKRIGRPPLPQTTNSVAEIKAVIAELPAYDYRGVYTILKRQALAASLKPPNHKRVYRIMKVYCCCRRRLPRAPRPLASASQPDSERPQQIAHLARFWLRAPKSALSRHSCFPSAGGGFPAATGG
jgi:hypothetical protein